MKKFRLYNSGEFICSLYADKYSTRRGILDIAEYNLRMVYSMSKYFTGSVEDKVKLLENASIIDEETGQILDIA